MNRRRVAELLRALADEVERGTPTAEPCGHVEPCGHDFGVGVCELPLGHEGSHRGTFGRPVDLPEPPRKPKPPALEDCGETYKSLEWGPLRCVKRSGHKGKRHRDASGVWWERMP